MSQRIDLKAALKLLEQVLLQRKSAGFDTVPLSRPGLAQLQKLNTVLLRARSSSGSSRESIINPTLPTPQSAPVPTAVVETPPPKVEPTPKPAPTAQPSNTPSLQPSNTPSLQPSNTPSLQPSNTPSLPPSNPYGYLAVKTEMRGRVEIIFPAGQTVRDKLNNLFRLAKRCEVCRGLGTLRDQLVFASGDPMSGLMYVGEAPTAEDEEARKPFSSSSGEKLTKLLQAMGLDREKVYLSNILKYRPKIGDGRFQERKNRKATPDELAASLKFVRSEIEIIKPRLIVALGATVAESLLEVSGSVPTLRGKTFQLDGIPVVVTYEPAHLVRLDRETDPEIARQEKRKAWEDALGIMEKLGMTITEKQRGFFNRQP